MGGEKPRNYTGFAGHRRIASGALADVALKAKEVVDGGERAPIAIFEDETGDPVDLDFRGTRDELLEKLARKRAREAAAQAEAEAEEPRKAGPGRPKLGVVSREVSLLPRHWEWLNAQPGGASVTLRKLVEEARRASQGADKARRSQEAAHKFMYALAGDLPGFEEASRAFFARSPERFDQHIQSWPEDVREHARKLVERAFRDAEEATRQANKGGST
ncbi:DUF2239 family protein [Archangium lipolyticum]|uniref:DUF2239 family protein n=1 Tax=Archangium lipolyticum TaxID=2970465 RepID=UPI00214A59B6|nr:DUF2239 family protein [Archangium lipolyticum]